MTFLMLREELRYALKNTKNGKATGPNQIPVETLKCLNEEIMDILQNSISNQWLLSTFCTLPKIFNASNCNDYRTISLINHS